MPESGAGERGSEVGNDGDAPLGRTARYGVGSARKVPGWELLPTIMGLELHKSQPTGILELTRAWHGRAT